MLALKTSIFPFHSLCWASIWSTPSSVNSVVKREMLFSGDYFQYRWQRQYDVHPVTGEFVMLQSPPGSADVEIVLDWFTELRQLAP